MDLQTLIRSAGIWRAGELSAVEGLPTGFPELDALLPGAGWPTGALTEILTDHQGIGALSLIMPALARLSRAQRWLIWAAPPHIPYAPALRNVGVDLSRLLVIRVPKDAASYRREVLWTLEQALRFELCGAALGWLNETPVTALRRLQLAAEAGGGWAVLYRPIHAARRPSPAALRLVLEPGAGKLRVRVLKCRGAWGGRSCELQACAD